MRTQLETDCSRWSSFDGGQLDAHLLSRESDTFLGKGRSVPFRSIIVTHREGAAASVLYLWRVDIFSRGPLQMDIVIVTQMDGWMALLGQ